MRGEQAVTRTKAPTGSVATQLYARVGVALALVVVGLGLVAISADRRARLADLEQRAETFARVLAAAMSAALDKEVRLAIRSFEQRGSSFPDFDFSVVFDDKGGVHMGHGVAELTESGEGFIVAARDESSPARRIARGEAPSTTRVDGIVWVREPLPNNHQLVVGFTTTGVEDSVRKTAAFIAVALFLALLIFFVVTWWAVKTGIARRIDEIVRGADAIGGGDLTLRIAVEGDDELTRLAQAFNAMTAELAEARATQRRFFSMVGHEVRSPVNAICGFVDDMLGDEDIPAHARANLVRVQRSAAQMRVLINDLLDLSKLEAARLEVHPSMVKVADLVADVAAEARALVGDRALSIEWSVEPKSLTFETDPVRLRQILLNLAANAVRFTPSGTVALSAREIDVGVEFVVRDEGIGIAPEHHAGVFEAFRQVHSEAHPRAGGTGLGLAIVKLLSELLHATLRLESAPHQGTTFTIRFPRVFSVDAPEPEPESESEPEPEPKAAA